MDGTLKEENIVESIIKWVSYLDGGKNVIPSINEKYYPMLKIKGQTSIFNWSIVIVNLEKNNDLTTISQIYFLVDDAPHNILVTGLEFYLFEGSKKVAEGKIL